MKDRLVELIKEGATFPDFIQAWLEVDPPSEKQIKLIAKARELYQEYGDLEFDDQTIASGSTDNGDYILCWKWVDNDEGEDDE